MGFWQVDDAGFESEIRMKIGTVVEKLSRLEISCIARNLAFQVGSWAFLGDGRQWKFLKVLVCVCWCLL